MTRAEIEEMLRSLAKTTRYLRETSRLTRKAAKRIGAVTERLTRLDAVGTTGGKVAVATAAPSRLRVWLKVSRRSQTSLAKEVGLSAAYLSMLIAGVRTPSLQVAKRLQAVTGIPATEFIGLNGKGDQYGS